MLARQNWPQLLRLHRGGLPRANPSFEPTRSGKSQLPAISFWVNCALPPRAAQLKR